MIDTDKYEGHTEGPWVIRTDKVAGATRMMTFFIRHYTDTECGISKLICSMQGIHEYNADAELIADAPLLLAEVKRLRDVLRDVKSDIDSYLNGGWNGDEGWEAISSIIGALGIQTDMDLMMEESE